MAEGLQSFVVSGDRVTGGGVASGLDESLEVVRLIWGTDVAEEVQQLIQYFPDPPVRAAEPESDRCPLDVG